MKTLQPDAVALRRGNIPNPSLTEPLPNSSVQELVGKDAVVKIKVDRLDEAFTMLSALSSIDVHRNGDQYLYVKTSEGEIGEINALLVNNGFAVANSPPTAKHWKKSSFD